MNFIQKSYNKYPIITGVILIIAVVIAYFVFRKVYNDWLKEKRNREIDKQLNDLYATHPELRSWNPNTDAQRLYDMLGSFTYTSYADYMAIVGALKYNEQFQMVADSYKALYKKNLKEDVISEFSGDLFLSDAEENAAISVWNGVIFN